MKITVRLFSGLRKYLPPNARDHAYIMDLKPGRKVIDVMESMGIPADRTKMVFINGEKVSLNFDEKLNDNDVITFYPRMAGG